MTNDSALSIEIQVPGKVMLSGEYAVMQEGGISLSLALNKYVRVYLEKLSDDSSPSFVSSSLWEEVLSFKKISELEKSQDLLIKTLSSVLSQFSWKPFSLKVLTEFPISSGFGSSSALRLSLFYAFCLYEKTLKGSLQRLDEGESLTLAQRAYEDQKNYQRRASGYDILTQKEGGLVLYKKEGAWPKVFSKLEPSKLLESQLHLFVGGQGAPTKSVMKSTESSLKDFGIWDDFCDLSKNLSLDLKDFLTGASVSVETLVLLFAKHRELKRGTPHFPVLVEKRLQGLKGFDSTWSFKTTGSGGEDALLFIGKDSDLDEAKEVLKNLGWRKDNWHLEPKGIRYLVKQGGQFLES